MKGIFYISFFFLMFNFSFAQVQRPYCDFEFKREIRSGDTDSDVLELQKFLNSIPDYIIATTGPGSPGRETNFFGNGTKINLSKYQNDNKLPKSGVLDFQTRRHINNFCTKVKANPVINTNTNIVVRIEPYTKAYKPGDTLRVKVKFSEAPKSLNSSMFILSNADITSVFKLSKTDFLIVLKTYDISDIVTIQIEAETVIGLNGGTNQEASNEIEIRKYVDPVTQVPPQTGTTTPEVITDTTIDLPNEDYTNLPIKTTSDLYSYLRNIFDTSFKRFAYNLGNSLSSLFGRQTYSPESGYNFKNFTDVDNFQSFVKSNLDNPNSPCKSGNTTCILGGFIGSIVSATNNFYRLVELELIEPGRTDYYSREFPRIKLSNEKVACRKIVTFDGNNVYQLFEGGDEYEFYKDNDVNTGLARLLIYPKNHYQYISQTCFGEAEVKDRYFRNGLYCCLDDECRRTDATYPIIFQLGSGQYDVFKLAYTVTPFNKGPNGAGTFSQGPSLSGQGNGSCNMPKPKVNQINYGSNAFERPSNDGMN
jgi:hypothetical protein